MCESGQNLCFGWYSVQVHEEEQEVGMAKDWSSKTSDANSIGDSYADTGCDSNSNIYINTLSDANINPDSHHCTSGSELCCIVQGARL
jgi:hypothetical protein